MLKLEGMHRQTEMYIDPPAMLRQMGGHRLLELAIFNNLVLTKIPGAPQTIQQIDMAQPRQEASQPD